MMKPTAVFPMSTPSVDLFQQLRQVTPLLKTIFERAFVSVNLNTCQALPEQITWLNGDNFFHITRHENNPSVGEDFLTLYLNAAVNSHPEQILHLFFIDRVAFVLQTEHQSAFISDIQEVTPELTPLIFQRTAVAWNTHPQNYRELENILTRTGEYLFGKSLDFAWCQIAVRADRLKTIVPLVQNRDMSILAEIILLMRDDVQTKEVDWLTWEDPFILGRDAHLLKAEREQSVQETRKRLSYIIPTLQLLKSAIETIS